MIHRGIPAVLLAVVAPALLLVWGWSQLQQPASLHGYAEQLQQKLSASDPVVVILGSSMAHRGIDTDMLSHDLGLRPDQVVLLQLPHAAQAHWYALLENRVYAAGYRPKLVLVAGAMTTMLNDDVLSESANVERLVEQLSEHEPVIASKVFGFDDPSDFRSIYVRERASAWRTSLLSSWRDGVVTGLFSRRKQLQEGQRIAEKVNEVVFANERMDYGLHRESFDGLHDGSLYERAAPTSDYDLRRDALVGDMDALADAHGSRLMYVRMPFPPSNVAQDVVPADIESDAVAWMEELGVGWLDLRSLDLDDGDFEDMRHLSQQGALRFTSVLGRTLAALRVLQPDGSVQVVKGVRGLADAQVVGALPALPQLAPGDTSCVRVARGTALSDVAGALVDVRGQVGAPLRVLVGGVELPRGAPTGGCSGTWAWSEGELRVELPAADADATLAWRTAVEDPGDGGGPVVWVLPGTSVRWSVAEPWALPPGVFQVLVRALSMREDGAAATLRVGDASFPIGAHGARLYGVFDPPAPERAWDVEVAVPAGAPPILLHHLAIGSAPATTTLLGLPETLFGASLRFVGGRVSDTGSRATYDAPPQFGTVPASVHKAPNRLAQVAIPELLDVADAYDRDAIRPNSCSPVRVLEDGTPLELPHALCVDVVAKGQGRSCHAGDTLFFAASDSTSPLTNGRRYELALDPRRRCDTWSQRGNTTLRGSWWLYPGDTATFPVALDALRRFREGANLLEVEVISHVADPEVPLELVLVADGEEVLSVPFTPERGTRRQHTARFALPRPIPLDVSDVSLRVRNPSRVSYVLLTMASLGESYAGFGPEAALLASATTGPRRPLALVGAERTGSVPVFPPARPPVRQPYEVWDIRLYPSWPFSNGALEKLGAPLVSPLRASVDGRDVPIVTSQRAMKSCGSCFMHIGQSLFMVGPGVGGARIRTWLDERFPYTVDDGTEVWWVFPGQEARWTVEAPPGTWDVHVVLHAVSAQKDRAGAGLQLRVGDAVSELVGDVGPGKFGGRVQGVQGGGPLQIRLTNAGLGYALVRELHLVGADETLTVLPRLDTGPVPAR